MDDKSFWETLRKDLLDGITSVNNDMRSGFASIEKRLDGVDKRFDGRMSRLEDRIGNLEGNDGRDES